MLEADALANKKKLKPSANGAARLRAPAVCGDSRLGPTDVAILDALPAHAAILDSNGIILAVNSHWIAFCRSNSGALEQNGVGADYVHVCVEAARNEVSGAAQTLSALEKILAGSLEAFESHYPCHSESAPRWFRARFAPFNTHGTRYVLVTHELTNHGDTLNNTFERLSLVVRKTSNGVILMDASGVIEWVNESFLRTTGFEFVDVVGRGFLSIIPSQGFDGRVAHRIELGMQRGSSFSVTMRNCRSDGSLFWAELRFEPICDEHGRVLNLVALQVDVSERRRLEHEVANVAIQERQRLVQDLHDSLGQELTGARLLIDAAISQLNTESAAILNLQDATLALQRSLAEVRLMARGLLPPHLTQGLSVALGSMAAHMSIPDRLAVHFVDDFRADVADKIAEQIYRIAQEAVTNAARHGEATEVNVRLSATKRGIALRIADNGRGFPPNVCGAGTGILTMRYRAELLNGHISFETNGALGTIVCCVAPV